MKILQVTAALEQGGVERGTVEMAAFIVRQQAESFVASQGGRMVEELAVTGAHHFCLPLARRNPISILFSAYKLAAFIKKEKIDLVHARSRAPAWAAYLACKVTAVPFITTFHGTHKIQNSFKKFYNSSMVKGLRVIAISQFIRQHIIENYQISDELIDIAPRGFDPERFDPDAYSVDQKIALRYKLGCAQDDFIIALPGRLTRWKGQVLLLSALAEIKHLSWKALLIGGAGAKTAYLDELKQKCIALGIDDRVTFCGNQHDIAPFYAISNLIVSASTDPEAFGRVAVEAQAMATPIVASAHGGSLETVKDTETGWLFENNNVQDLVRCLVHAISGQVDLMQMGARGREWVNNNYTIDRMCNAEWLSYKKVLNIN